MTTNLIEYTGSDEQIAELRGAKNGYVIRYSNDKISNIAWNDCIKNSQFVDWKNGERHCPTHYWLIPDDPLREMKVRQAMTGQPVYWRNRETGELGMNYPGVVHWEPDLYEYSFTEFKD